MDVFSQTTTRESTEVPKRCFSPASHCHWAAVADGTRNSEFTNKLTNGKHTVPNFAFDVYPRVLLTPRPQKGIYFLSQTTRIDRSKRSRREGESVVFRHGIITFVALTRLAWIYRLRKLTLVRQSKRQIY